MTYDPNQLEPPDNPNAKYCDYCSEQLMDDEDAVHLLFRHNVHWGCLVEYCNGVLLHSEQTDKKIEKMVERGMS